MEKKQKLQRIWLVLSGMAFWGLMMPATILGILISIGVIYILISVAAVAVEERKIVFDGRSGRLLAAFFVLYCILWHSFFERWILSSKIQVITTRMGIKNDTFISMVAIAGIICSLYFTAMVISLLVGEHEKISCISCENLQWKMNVQDILICLLIAVIFGFELATAPFANGYPGTDSAAFLYIGRRMHEGAIPYVDLFDHKGIILYLIEYFGLSISGGKFFGVWILEIAGLFATAILVMKIAALFSEKKEAGYLSVVGTLFIFTGYMTIEGGNVVEEYALPWITVALYIVLRYFVEDTYRRRDITWLGISFAVVFLLRANMITAWAALLPVVFFYLIYKKRYADIGKCILWFVIGCAVVFVPAFLYFVKTDSLKAMMDCYFTFNFGYSDKESGFLPIIMTMVYLIGETALGWLVLILSGVACKKKELWLLNLWFFVVSLLLSAMSGRNYQHYGIMLVPAFIVPLVVSADWLLGFKKEKEKKGRILVIVATVTVLLAGVNIVKYNGNGNISEAAAFLRENTSEGDDVLVLGNNSRYYLESGRKTENRFFYQTPPINVNDELYGEFEKELVTKMPVCVIVPGSKGKTEDDNYKKVLEQFDAWEKEGAYSCVEFDSFYAYMKK